VTSILIPTFLRDIHSTAVAIALSRRGESPTLWHGADMPTRQQGSMALSPVGELEWEVSGAGLPPTDRHFDVVWNRRPSPPILPPDLPIPDSDLYVARRECQAFQRGLWSLLAPDAFWVNSPEGRARASAKPAQLVAATAAGFSIPPTLISNDPERIRRFVGQHEGHALYKPFVPTHWDMGSRGVAFAFASPVTLADLPDDEVLRLSPGIFQRRIAKAHELRLTVMGDKIFAARLLSQDREESRIDWRNAFTRLAVEPAELSAEDAERCQRVMADLGIVFGCIDMIVTPDEELVFLEVNEMGQFLWLDETNPEINTLAPFCEFLLQGRPDFTWEPSAKDPVYLDLRDEAAAYQEEVDAEIHVERPKDHLAPEGTPPPPTETPPPGPAVT